MCPRFKRSTEGGRAFAVRGTKEWNKLSVDIKQSTRVKSFKRSLFTIILDNYWVIMAVAAAAGRSLARKPGRLKWTDQMNQDLLECKEKALSLKSSSNPPCYQNGRKKGYMRILKDLWEDLGYENLGLSAQNLRDHAAAITEENPPISARGDSSTV